MKLRKSKSDRSFRIDYSVQALGVVTLRPKSSVRDVTWFREEVVWTKQPIVIAVGPNRGSVLRGFFWGQDKNNIRIDRCVCMCHL
jgi:hypothetical protein